MKSLSLESKKLTFYLLALFAFAITASGAGEFDQVDGVVDSLNTTLETTAGTGMRIFMGWLPLILFCIGLFLGVKQAKKSSEQDQENSSKVFISGAIGGIAGGIVGVLVDGMLGAVLMGDSAKGLEVLQTYWADTLGV